jgi:hypothetical protein
MQNNVQLTVSFVSWVTINFPLIFEPIILQHFLFIFTSKHEFILTPFNVHQRPDLECLPNAFSIYPFSFSRHCLLLRPFQFPSLGTFCPFLFLLFKPFVTHLQCDQIGRIFATLAIVNFGHFCLKISKVDHIFGLLLSTVKDAF